jgi:hypothetical protein
MNKRMINALKRIEKDLLETALNVKNSEDNIRAIMEMEELMEWDEKIRFDKLVREIQEVKAEMIKQQYEYEKTLFELRMEPNDVE